MDWAHLSSLAYDIKPPLTINNLTLLKKLILAGYIPKYEFALDRPVEENDDIKNYLINIEMNFRGILHALNVLKDEIDNESLENKNLKSCIITLILLISEHNEISFWTNESILNHSGTLKNFLCEICHVDNFHDLLFCSNESSRIFNIYSDLLNELSPKLLKDTWKQYPGAIYSFKFLFFQTKQPHLGKYLKILLPTCLLLIDDFEKENRLLGIECLTHLMQNVTQSELNWLNHGKVIYSCLEHMLNERKKIFIKPLIQSLLLILQLLEDGYNDEDKKLDWSLYDDCFQKFLISASIEQNHEVCILYLESLIDFVSTMKQSVIRWGSALMAYIKDNFEVGIYSKNYNQILLSLDLLSVYLKMAWMTLPYNYEKLISILGKLIIDVKEVEDDEAKINIMMNISVIFTIIKDCAPEALKLLKKMNKNCKSKLIKDVIKEVI